MVRLGGLAFSKEAPANKASTLPPTPRPGSALQKRGWVGGAPGVGTGGDGNGRKRRTEETKKEKEEGAEKTGNHG